MRRSGLDELRAGLGVDLIVIATMKTKREALAALPKVDDALRRR